MEVVEQLARAPRPVLGLGLAVVPGDAARLPLDVRSRDVGRDTPQEPLDRPQPGEVEVDQRPPLPARRAREVAVLGAEVDGQPPEPLLEVPAPPAADDVHVGGGKRRERSEQRADLGRRLGEIGVDLELAQRAVVVEQDRPRPRAREPAREPLLDRRVDRRRSARTAVAPRVAPEPREEALGPAPAVESLDALRHRLEPPLSLPRRQLERASSRCSTTPSTFHGLTSSAPGSTCAEPASSERSSAPRQRLGQPRLRLAEHELLRDEVHPVAERRDHHHVGAPVERDERGLRDVAVHVLDRRDARSREAAVDARDEELDLVPLRAVLGALEARRDDHLDHASSSARAPDPARGSARTRGASAGSPSCSRAARHRGRAGAPRTASRDRRGAARSRARRSPRESRRRRSRSDRRRCRRDARRARASRAPSRCRASAGTTSGSGARSRRPGS